MLKKTRSQRGFTLAEVIITLSIVFVLTISLAYIGRHSLETSRNKERVIALEAYKTALEQYYHDHGKYPGCTDSCWPSNQDSFPGPCGGTGPDYPHGGLPRDYVYGANPASCTGSAAFSESLAYENSESCGFMEFLIDAGYIDTDSNWADPLLNGCDISHSSPFNCRYVVTEDERDACNVQRYLLHCFHEGESDLAIQDGGTHDQVYEIYGGTGEPWMCIADTP